MEINQYSGSDKETNCHAPPNIALGHQSLASMIQNQKLMQEQPLILSDRKLTSDREKGFIDTSEVLLDASSISFAKTVGNRKESEIGSEALG